MCSTPPNYEVGDVEAAGSNPVTPTIFYI